MLYKFNYFINDKTKEQITAEINLLNDKNTFVNFLIIEKTKFWFSLVEMFLWLLLSYRNN